MGYLATDENPYYFTQIPGVLLLLSQFESTKVSTPSRAISVKPSVNTSAGDVTPGTCRRTLPLLLSYCLLSVSKHLSDVFPTDSREVSCDRHCCQVPPLSRNGK